MIKEMCGFRIALTYSSHRNVFLLFASSSGPGNVIMKKIIKDWARQERLSFSTLLLERGYGILKSQAAESHPFLRKEHKIPGLPAPDP